MRRRYCLFSGRFLDDFGVTDDPLFSLCLSPCPSFNNICFLCNFSFNCRKMCFKPTVFFCVNSVLTVWNSLSLTLTLQTSSGQIMTIKIIICRVTKESSLLTTRCQDWFNFLIGLIKQFGFQYLLLFFLHMTNVVLYDLAGRVGSSIWREQGRISLCSSRCISALSPSLRWDMEMSPLGYGRPSCWWSSWSVWL